MAHVPTRNVSSWARWVGRSSRRIVITTVGFSLIAVGVVLLVIPGPGLLLIAAGLAVLATEYAWARTALNATKERAARFRARVRKDPLTQGGLGGSAERSEAGVRRTPPPDK